MMYVKNKILYVFLLLYKWWIRTLKNFKFFTSKYKFDFLNYFQERNQKISVQNNNKKTSNTQVEDKSVM